ncbi:polyprenyl synthetase family protein [Streptomyces sp. E11-3]|uniref:polyprenyl synthetase family protein n=1 Tax=Streptomyces sp. E11-3 TaxID=3110112 RepID=UPI0039815567
MNSLSYVELHEQVAPDIEAEIAAALERLGPPSSTLRNAVTRLLEHRKLKHPLSVLPMLVHAVETGTTKPAVPLAAVHVLWWTSACYLDDLADGHGAIAAGGLDENEALLASVITGNTLPLHTIASPRVPASAHGALIAEVMTGWNGAAEGQLADMRGDIGSATRRSVITAYRMKSGGPFGMITAMAAVLSGAPSERIDQWREFGCVFGILWQLFNDQEDILSGRDEDQLNGTVTYLLASAVEDASPASRERILSLHSASKTSHEARAELASLLLAPAVLARYREDITAYRDDAHCLLDKLGGDQDHVPALRQLVDQAAQMLLEARQA